MAHQFLWGCAAVLCLALSFLFSGMEAGVFALSRIRIRQKMRAGDSRARVLLGFLEHPENFLWTILAGNTLANGFAVCLVAAKLLLWWGDRPIYLWTALTLFVFLLYAVGDLLPKMLFQNSPNRLCLALARPFRFVHLGLAPGVSLMTWVAQRLLRGRGRPPFTGRLFADREELRLVMHESAQGFSSEERTLINRVLDFQSLTARHAMMPLEKVVTVTATTPMTQVLQLCRERRLTRLLVERAEGARRRILGLVSLKTVLYLPELEAHKTVGDYLTPALFINEDLRLEEALRRMQRSGQRLAIVLGRDAREVGVLSLQDILKALFGNVTL